MEPMLKLIRLWTTACFIRLLVLRIRACYKYSVYQEILLHDTGGVRLTFYRMECSSPSRVRPSSDENLHLCAKPDRDPRMVDLGTASNWTEECSSVLGTHHIRRCRLSIGFTKSDGLHKRMMEGPIMPHRDSPHQLSSVYDSMDVRSRESRKSVHRPAL